MTHYGIDWAEPGSDKTVIIIYGIRGGKTFFSRLWMHWRYTDQISKQIIRRLAAEAVINISINS